MKITDLDYELPEELIAQEATTERTDSRLMVVDRSKDELAHRHFRDVIEYLNPGDCLVVNDSKVIPARFYVQRATGGIIEGLFLNINEDGVWEVLLKGASRLKIDEKVQLCHPDGGESTSDESDRPALIAVERQGNGKWLLRQASEGSALEWLEEYGVTPLPPYIKRGHDSGRDKKDRSRYQNVYAGEPGSVAAPTAGLHFSDELLEKIKAKGIKLARVTLHVGLGTFKGIETDQVEAHQMHAEFYRLDEANASLVNQTKQYGGRIIAVGTTAIRTLESTAQHGRVVPGEGWTRLFITPGYDFQIINAIVTNYHLPRTSLLALVCAFAGQAKIMNAYRTAVAEKYRFFSYGDAMLII